MYINSGNHTAGLTGRANTSVLTRPLPKGTMPFEILMCPLWSGLRTKCVRLKYLTRLGLSNIMNLIMHPA